MPTEGLEHLQLDGLRHIADAIQLLKIPRVLKLIDGLPQGRRQLLLRPAAHFCKAGWDGWQGVIYARKISFGLFRRYWGSFRTPFQALGGCSACWCSGTILLTLLFASSLLMMRKTTVSRCPRVSTPHDLVLEVRKCFAAGPEFVLGMEHKQLNFCFLKPAYTRSRLP